MNPLVIGLAGRKRHGKDSVASMLNLELTDPLKATEPAVARVSLAGPLKAMAKRLYGWDGEKDAFGRWLLQRLGTERVRRISEGYWVEQAERTIARASRGAVANGVEIIAVTDVRFPDEAALVKRLGGEMWKVVRLAEKPKALITHPSGTGNFDFRNLPKGAGNIIPVQYGKPDAHASETALDGYDGWDAVLEARDLDELHGEVKKQLRRLAEDGKLPRGRPRKVDREVLASGRKHIKSIDAATDCDACGHSMYKHSIESGRDPHSDTMAHTYKCRQCGSGKCKTVLE